MKTLSSELVEVYPSTAFGLNYLIKSTNVIIQRILLMILLKDKKQ